MMACHTGVDFARERADGRLFSGRILGSLCLALLCGNAGTVRAESAQTANFRIIAESCDIAEQLALQAEELRLDLAEDWLGRDLPDWEQPCVVQVTLCPRLSGDTTYTLGQAGAVHWRMVLRGPVERIVETLLPHEVLHTVLASHYRQAVPRWADEGAALSVEAQADQVRLWAQEGPRLLNGRRLSVAELFASEEYPEDPDELRAFYVQGAAVTKFLLHAGKSRFLEFVELGITDGWEHAVAVHYGFADLDCLESAWIGWLRDSRPAIALKPGQLLSDVSGLTVATPIAAAERVPALIPGDSQGGL